MGKIEKRLKYDKKGITLIALVITIIVLLILAGISISMLTGQNGILNKATEAKIETIIGQEKDQIALAYNSALVNNLGNTVTTKDLQQELDELVGANKATVTSGSSGILKVLFLETTNNYKVNNGKISIITGDEPEVEPTSIYAKLYSYTNGSGDVLILSSYDYQETATDLTLRADYGDISGDEYYWDSNTGEGNLAPWVDIDWENEINKNNIIEAKIIDTIVPKTTACYFFCCENIQNLNLENLDTSQVNNMRGMFGGCRRLMTLDLSCFDTSNVTDMSFMFTDCQTLTTLDLSNFDTSNVTDMSRMFTGCGGLTTLDLSNFDTSNVTDMSSMFSHCQTLTTLDLSNFDTSNVTDMSYMFSNSPVLDMSNSLGITNWDVRNVISFECMFLANGEDVTWNSIDISNWDISESANISAMFQGNFIPTLTVYVKNAEIQSRFQNDSTQGSKIYVIK